MKYFTVSVITALVVNLILTSWFLTIPFIWLLLGYLATRWVEAVEEEPINWNDQEEFQFGIMCYVLSPFMMIVIAIHDWDNIWERAVKLVKDCPYLPRFRSPFVGE